MITVDRLTKTFGLERAVDDISFEVERGEVLGFLGPNGAGKSTTMRVLTCYLPPTAGHVTVNGLDVTTESLSVRRLIGYLPENTPLYPDMTVRDYLRFVAAIREMSASDERTRISYVVDVCGLTGVMSKRIETLSKGYRQRVGLAQAMLHDPEILILDEPTSGLDPNQIVEIRELVLSLGQQKTVILSTHILPEVEASCDRVLIINRGKIVADGSPESLQARFQGDQRLLFGVSGDGDGVEPSLLAVPGVSVLERSAENGATVFTLGISGGRDVRRELFRLAVDNDWVLTELHREEARLEDVFRQLTTEKAHPSVTS